MIDASTGRAAGNVNKVYGKIRIMTMGGFMKIVFVSNYFNHHQKPFCEEMYRRIGADFSFVSTSVMREERKKLGYSQDDQPEYVLPAYESNQKYNEALARINDADVVIAGSAPNDMLLERIRKGKLLLRYSERPFKKQASYLRKIYHAIRFHQMDLWKNNIYMLCASAYTSGDYESIGMYKNRAYKWGYFPEVKEYDVDALMSSKKQNTLMWCGRFIDWKHPDDVIELANKLNVEGYDFHLNLVGMGVMEKELLDLVEKYDLSDRVHFLGSMPPSQVRAHMEAAGIYLFTSDRQEGWGAVLNESMNSGCAVVASHAIGSVPYLLKNNKNGCIYQSENVSMMYEKVKLLLDHPEEQDRLGRAAYSTISTEWNAETATNRLLNLVDCLLKNEHYPDLYDSGLCSRAEQIYDDWFK